MKCQISKPGGGQGPPASPSDAHVYIAANIRRLRFALDNSAKSARS